MRLIIEQQMEGSEMQNHLRIARVHNAGAYNGDTQYPFRSQK